MQTLLCRFFYNLEYLTYRAAGDDRWVCPERKDCMATLTSFVHWQGDTLAVAPTDKESG